MPAVLLDLCAHVTACEILVARWAAGDVADHLALVRFPGEQVSEYARRSFADLKRSQAKLLGASRSSA
ncbi:hypothetical protein ACFPIJ_23705 [Dactylosporangium cerinum]|uniref:Uncharacterized protein n=1 Tax=Dactylosporangium cerinum TaxID=1434730 RepID=A0ABV9VZI4_9ACTN